MERKLNAELWDKMHYLFRDYNDRMVHLRLDYDFLLDVEALKTVLICFFEKAPVLHSAFKDNHINPCWLVKPYHIDEVLTVAYPEDVDAAADAFLTQGIPPESEIQMKVAVFFKDGKSTLCMIENHMCMDGGDFKYFMKAFCKNYNDFCEKGISPIDLREGSRSYDRIYSDFSQTEQRMAKNLYKNVCSKDDHKFPLTPDSIRDRSFIARRKLSAETLQRVKTAGKALGATVNDMLLTAYFYSLYSLARYPETDSVTIACAIDLRRHLKDTENEGLTNHTAWMQCNVPQRGKTILETLQYVVHSVNQFKQDKFMGLYGLPLLKFAYSAMPYAVSEEIIKIGYSNPLLAMSNIGILDAVGLALQGHEPTDGFMTGAVKYKPFVLLSATTLHGEMTLSMCVRGNEEDQKTVEAFFDLMEENLRALCQAGQ